MDNNSFQTSFIPKKPILSATTSSPRVHESMSIFTFLAIIFLIISCLASLGLYLYRGTLIVKVKTMQASLKATKSDFEADTISELQFFDKRMSASRGVLAGHKVLSPVFSLLSSLTIPSVQFTKFTTDSTEDGKNINVKMSGVAKDYKSIALQAQVFNSNQGKYFKDVVFSNLTLSEDKEHKGYVKFEIAFSVDPALISYEKNISQTNKTGSPATNKKLP